MVAFFLALWAVGGFHVLLFFVVFPALMAVPITISAALTRLMCGRPHHSSIVK